MNKPRLSAFPAVLFATGLGLLLYFGYQYWRLPQYSAEDIENSVDINLGLERRSAISTPAEAQSARVAVRQEVLAAIEQDRRDALGGVALGLIAFVLACGQLIFSARLGRVQPRT